MISAGFVVSTQVQKRRAPFEIFFTKSRHLLANCCFDGFTFSQAKLTNVFVKVVAANQKRC